MPVRFLVGLAVAGATADGRDIGIAIRFEEALEPVGFGVGVVVDEGDDLLGSALDADRPGGRGVADPERVATVLRRPDDARRPRASARSGEASTTTTRSGATVWRSRWARHSSMYSGRWYVAMTTTVERGSAHRISVAVDRPVEGGKERRGRRRGAPRRIEARNGSRRHGRSSLEPRLRTPSGARNVVRASEFSKPTQGGRGGVKGVRRGGGGMRTHPRLGSATGYGGGEGGEGGDGREAPILRSRA